MYKDWSYKEVEGKADAIKELGFTEIYLNKGTMPWHLATQCKPGGSHRLEIATDVWFSGVSQSRIPIRWSFDIEPSSANGMGTYQIDMKGCRKVLACLKEPCLTEFRNYLHACADAVQANAEKLQKIVDNEQETVRMLRSI